ncbi:MAG: ribosome biogenesis/translation initiation ATPase RLI [Candidatus Pacearchaeota archaeon]
MKLAIIHKEKCRPTACGKECKKYCPVEKKESDSCITIENKAKINEKTCIGCGICQKRCPFGAIEIINLPSIKEEDLIYRYEENGFALYGLPTPKEGSVLGLLGRNGIGKSTAIKILSGQEKINFGKETDKKEILDYFQGSELRNYFAGLEQKKISYKPQNLSKLSQNVKVVDLLKQFGKENKIRELAKELNIERILENKMNTLSGGELQKTAILTASLKPADAYFFDEPLAYLDINERIRVSDFIKKISEGKTLIVVEHDLLILDYLTDSINVFFGSPGAFGLVSGVKTSKYGINSYLQGFLKEENLRIREKELNFNFTKNPQTNGHKIATWPSFNVQFKEGFRLNVKEGSIYQNQVIGILGKNGTGKSTFVKALIGETQTDIGKIKLDLKISYKPQYLFTESEETIRDICFKEKINKKISSLFNLGVLQQKKLKELSGGELQRFSIARCLTKDADVYFLDEPSAYLDVEERVSSAKAIKEIINEKQKTAFVVDHDLLLISYLADSIINFEGESGIEGISSEEKNFEEGISDLLKSLDITLRKDKETGRPRINKKNSVLDREQKEKEKWAVF